LPFFWSPPNVIELSTAGASTSISSSKSDIAMAELVLPAALLDIEVGLGEYNWRIGGM
jgi:hypothetical protein